MITSSARHGNTSIDAVEKWDIDKLIDYSESIARVVKAENAPNKRSE